MQTHTPTPEAAGEHTLLPSIKSRQFFIEIIIIIAFGIFSARDYANFDSQFTLAGREAQWLTSSALWASQSVREYGYLQFWQPYLVRGEPTIDSPFSFAISPINALPSILIGYPNGIKVSVILSVIVAGLGGWYLARVLGLHSPARVLLGLLMMVKGPMLMAIGSGYFQLGTTQAYIPWIVASAVAIGRQPQRRYPVVLFAISVTFQFWGGNIYFTLPSLIMAVSILALYTLRQRRETDQVQHRFSIVIDRLIWRRSVLALGMTAGLAAITFLPIFLHQSYIGGHPLEKGAGTVVDPMLIFTQLFAVGPYITTGVNQENFYIYTLPIWAAVLTLLLLPGIERWLPRAESAPDQQRSGAARDWRIWTVGAISLFFFWLWGTGTNPIIEWAYARSPFLASWRFVARMLTVVSFWVAIFAVMRFDWVYGLLNPAHHFKKWSTDKTVRAGQAWLNMLAGFGLVMVMAYAVWQVNDTRRSFGAIVKEDPVFSQCLEWLREQHPDEQLAVYTRDYVIVSPFIRNGIRFSNLTADFDPIGAASTLYPYDLTEAMPKYAILYDPAEREAWVAQGGYVAVEGSPKLPGDIPCLFKNANTLSYAFQIPLKTLNELALVSPPPDVRFPIDPALTSPIDTFVYHPGQISMQLVNGTGEDMVIVLQEITWPGWSVTVNGKPAQLESVGQLMGIILPSDPTPKTIVFEYTPRELIYGAFITLATCAFGILYLLSVDRTLVRLVRRTIPVSTVEPETPRPVSVWLTSGAESANTDDTESVSSDKPDAETSSSDKSDVIEGIVEEVTEK